jgi:hypothetical protein
MRTLTFVLLCLVGFGCAKVSGEEEAKRSFDRAYDQWVSDCKRPEIAISSDTRTYTSLPSYRAIIALGRSALPYLRQKMEHDTGFDFMLAYAAIEIEGWHLSEFHTSSGQELRDRVLAKMRANE